MSYKILLISSNSSAYGGGERYLVYLSQGLKTLGHEVHALLSDVDFMNVWAKELEALGVTVHRQHLRGLVHRPLRFVQAILDDKQIKTIANVCRKIRPDAILVNQQYDEDGLDYIAGSLRSQVAVVGGIIHMPMTKNKNRRPLGSLRGKLLTHWYARHPYNLLLVSEGAQQEFEQYYPYPRPTIVVNHGVPFDDTTQFETPLLQGFSLQRPVVGFVGKLVPQKNLDLLLKGWLEANRLGSSCQLLIVGDGPLRPDLETWLHQHGVAGDCNITGWQTQPQQFFPLIDLLVMTSHFEGFPLSLIEAAGHGVPALVTNFNGATDISKRAAWVKIVPEQTSECLGSMISSTIPELPYLKALAQTEKSNFRTCFSLERMASDTLAALGLN